MHTQAFPTSSTTLSEIAAEAAAQFKATTRNTASGPEPVVTLRDGTPSWLSQAIYDAHEGMLPEDWRFSTAQEACEAIAHGGGYENMPGAAERFTADVHACEETTRAGQALERSELFHAILTAIEDEQIEREIRAN